MQQRAGRLTLAASLIILGGVLVTDNLLGTELVYLLARLWPGLLILLGLEWLLLTGRLQEPGHRVKTDGGAIAILVIIALVAANLGSRRGPFTVTPSPQVRISFSTPPMPPIPPAPSGFRVIAGNVQGEHRSEKPLQLSAGSELVISAGSGSITVMEGAEPRIELHVVTYGRAKAEAEANARRVQLKIQEGATLRVSPEVPPDINRLELRLAVTVPKGIKLRVDTSSGAVSVTGHEGELTVQSTSGAIRVANASGPVDLRSASGGIAALDIAGRTSVTTSSGAVLLRQVDGPIKVGTTSGAINIEQPGGSISAQASSGAIVVTAAAVAGEYELGSSSGSVRLRLPANADLTLNARSTSGVLSGPGWVTMSEGRNSGNGTLGDGAHKVTIRTSSGSITIEAGPSS